MSKQVVSTSQAPAAIGPYSQAIRCGNLVFVSGQIPFVPETGQLLEGDAGVQTSRVLQNLEAILKAAGSSLGQALKTTVYLKDMADFAKMNEAYARFFTERPPARATVEVARLPRDVSVEIDVIAEVEGSVPG